MMIQPIPHDSTLDRNGVALRSRSDHDLMRQIAEGRRLGNTEVLNKSFDEFTRRYDRTVVCIASRYLGPNSQDVQEVVNAV